jgi:hypothetical protein
MRINADMIWVHLSDAPTKTSHAWKTNSTIHVESPGVPASTTIADETAELQYETVWISETAYSPC